MGNDVQKVEGAVAITPMQMLSMAVEQGADLDKLQKLMDLQERWEKNEARKAFVAAMTAFKKTPPKIVKNKDVFHKETFMYKHATLDNVADIIIAALSEVGISHSWHTEQGDGGKISVTCVLTHELGHSERTTLSAGADQSGAKNSIQAIGSTVTYLERYTLLAATGIAVGNTDSDGADAGKAAPMESSQVADFMLAVDDASDLEALEAIWQKILIATKGDADGRDKLKTAVLARKKLLTPSKGA